MIPFSTEDFTKFKKSSPEEGGRRKEKRFKATWLWRHPQANVDLNTLGVPCP